MRLLYISSIDYRYAIKQRPQYFVELLSQWHEVDFLSFTDWNAILQVLKGRQRLQFLKLPKNLYIHHILRLPFNRFRVVFFINNLIKKCYFYSLIRNNNYDYIIITNPIDYLLLPKDIKSLLVYDCIDKMDTFIQNSQIKKMLFRLEGKLVKQANFVTCVSKALSTYLGQYRKDIIVINNGVNLDLFHNVFNKDCKLASKLDFRSFKIGFIGAIGEWVDIEFIKEVAKELPDIKFYWVGPIISKKTSDLSNNNNIAYLGVCPHEDLPALLNKLDICLLPFKINNTAKYANPVKIYEYLALGKPVLARFYLELKEEFGDLIYYYSNKKEFINLVNEILSKREPIALIKKRKDFAYQNTWQAQVEKFNNLLLNYTKQNK